MVEQLAIVVQGDFDVQVCPWQVIRAVLNSLHKNLPNKASECLEEWRGSRGCGEVGGEERGVCAAGGVAHGWV